MTPELAALAAAQRGAFTRRQALMCGVSSGKIDRRLYSGAWLRLRPGVYADASSPEPLGVLAIAAALLVVGPDAAASHWSAALLHDIDLLAAREAHVALTAYDRDMRLDGVHVFGGGVPGHHVTVSGGLRVTTKARTVVDIARRLPFRNGVVAADSALRCGVPRDDLEQVLRDCAVWPGIRHAIDVVSFADGRTESPFESVSRVLMRELSLPRPELQVWLGQDRVDFLWPAHRTIGEADGMAKYAAGGTDPREALALERLREERLRARGYEVVRWWWRHLDEPHGFGLRIRRAFDRGDRLR